LKVKNDYFHQQHQPFGAGDGNVETEFLDIILITSSCSYFMYQLNGAQFARMISADSTTFLSAPVSASLRGTDITVHAMSLSLAFIFVHPQPTTR
jgi:hypothetical protein